MGVLGLAPFLQKTFPEVFRHLPDRLKGLNGKTVVIDGTLITQRLHFAQFPHQHRHVLGWYRLVKELNECGVRTICVFDGKERSQAKAREAKRRKDVQNMAIARGSIEFERLRRLRKLTGLLYNYKQLGDKGRQRVTALLQNMASSWIPLGSTFSGGAPDILKGTGSTGDVVAAGLICPPGNLLIDISDESLVQTANKPCPEFSGSVRQPAKTCSVDHEDQSPCSNVDDTSSDSGDTFTYDATPGQFDMGEHPNARSIREGPRSEPVGLHNLLADVDEVFQATNEEHPLWILEEQQFSSTLDLDQRDIVTVTLPSDSPGNELVEDLPSALATLYLDYRKSITTIAALSSSVSPSSQPDVIMDLAEARTEYAMSKHQLQLTLDEGTLWNELTYPTVPLAGESTTQAAVASLAEKSNMMSQSYQRRTHPPATHTYDESKAILQALGVPCLESTGSFEAEALAASLVINGHADYVASEDTDVLIYEAPMIRNITNRSGPLVIVSGKDVRTVLQLDRPSYVDFALLLGTDFSQRIKNVGPQRALRFIREHGCIERVIECETKYPPREPADAYLEQVGLARLVFQTLPPVPDVELLQPQECDEQSVAEILQRFGLHRAAIYDWDYEASLNGNYFEDDPRAY